MTTKLRSAMMVVHATCQTLIQRLDPDEADQASLIARLHDVCGEIQTALQR